MFFFKCVFIFHFHLNWSVFHKYEKCVVGGDGLVWRGTWRDASYHLCNQTEILMFFMFSFQIGSVFHKCEDVANVWRSGSGSSHAGRRQLWLQPNTKHSTHPPLFCTAKCCKLCVWQITKHPSWLLHLCRADDGEQEEKHPDKFVLMGGPGPRVPSWSSSWPALIDILGRLVPSVIHHWQSPKEVPYLGLAWFGYGSSWRTS